MPGNRLANIKQFDFRIKDTDAPYIPGIKQFNFKMTDENLERICDVIKKDCHNNGDNGTQQI